MARRGGVGSGFLFSSSELISMSLVVVRLEEEAMAVGCEHPFLLCVDMRDRGCLLRVLAA